MRPFAAVFFTALVLCSCATQADPKAAEFVDLAAFIPGITVELPYATEHNFFKHRFYHSNHCLLRREVAEKLQLVQMDLNSQGLALKVWDGYRPRSVQWEFWKVMPDEKYVADPRKGSRHNRGAAVDVTLIELKSGRELPMPTGFDDFTPKAAANYPDLPEEAKRNRALLQEAMTRRGFVIFASEWWHFDSKGWEKFPIEDFK